MKSAVLFVLIPLMVCLPTEARSELKLGAGIGIQYGGVVGVQGAYVLNKTKLKLALGLPGLTAGIEQQLSDKYSIGVQGFGIGYSAGWGIYSNYYLSAGDGKSWVMGLDFIRKVESTYFTTMSETKNRVSVSVGYGF